MDRIQRESPENQQIFGWFSLSLSAKPWLKLVEVYFLNIWLHRATLNGSRSGDDDDTEFSKTRYELNSGPFSCAVLNPPTLSGDGAANPDDRGMIYWYTWSIGKVPTQSIWRNTISSGFLDIVVICSSKTLRLKLNTIYDTFPIWHSISRWKRSMYNLIIYTWSVSYHRDMLLPKWCSLSKVKAEAISRASMVLCKKPSGAEKVFGHEGILSQR